MRLPEGEESYFFPETVTNTARLQKTLAEGCSPTRQSARHLGPHYADTCISSTYYVSRQFQPNTANRKPFHLLEGPTENQHQRSRLVVLIECKNHLPKVENMVSPDKLSCGKMTALTRHIDQSDRTT